jgi:uncharacterized membrane protein (UPF0182 family)
MNPDIRYPEDLFFIRAQVYRTYHMNSAGVFYNREDLWQFLFVFRLAASAMSGNSGMRLLN